MESDGVSCTVMHWDALGCTGMQWDALGCTGMQWDAVGCTEMRVNWEGTGGPKSLGLGERRGESSHRRWTVMRVHGRVWGNIASLESSEFQRQRKFKKFRIFLTF